LLISFVHDAKGWVCTELECPLLNEFQYPLPYGGVSGLDKPKKKMTTLSEPCGDGYAEPFTGVARSPPPLSSKDWYLFIQDFDKQGSKGARRDLSLCFQSAVLGKGFAELKKKI